MPGSRDKKNGWFWERHLLCSARCRWHASSRSGQIWTNETQKTKCTLYNDGNWLSMMQKTKRSFYAFDTSSSGFERNKLSLLITAACLLLISNRVDVDPILRWKIIYLQTVIFKFRHMMLKDVWILVIQTSLSVFPTFNSSRKIGRDSDCATRRRTFAFPVLTRNFIISPW